MDDIKTTCTDVDRMLSSSGRPSDGVVKTTDVDQSLPQLAVRIQQGDRTAENSLCAVMSRGLRCILARQVPEYVDDGVQEVLLILIEGLRAGRVRSPEAVAAYAQTLARRYAISRIKEISLKRNRESVIDLSLADSKINVEREIAGMEKRELMQAAFRKLDVLDREILSQFYVQDRSPEQICETLSLSETQFRIRKHRAKNKLIDEMRRLTRPTVVKRMAAAAAAFLTTIR